ncbi:MAG: efflux RND transporter periplasmic adaptor subunit [Bacteroidaceae bacterium]|nr:efflux RND transporter periplasmic adaptor subunit [Bacteroidaceae bacterium]MBR1791027.1 efflux RND transporter periplasmic adaptor subunit [Bacteroidaceae bacterium]
MDRQIPLSVQRKRKMIRVGRWLVGFLLVMAAGAWLGSQMLTTIDRKTLVVSEVDRGTIEVSVTATGRIVPAFEEVITSPISSRILEVYAHSGDSVDVGTPLLRLDLQSTETELAKAMDEREIRRQQMEQLRANIETQLADRRMQIEVEEMKLSQLEAQLRNELYLDSLGSGTRDRVRSAETTLRTAQLQLAQLRQQYANEVRVKQADLRMQQLQNGIFEKGLTEKQRTLADAAICSPRRATLTYITTEIGATVGAGQKLAIVSDLSHFKAECEISDTYSDRVLVGGEALLRIGKERLPATISTVTPLSQGGAITFTVQPQDPSHPRLRSGLKTEVYVITSIRDDVLRIRNGSFYAGPGKYTLFIFKDDQTLVPREVQLGECNYDYIEVLSGLSEGEELVVSDMGKYKGKEKLRVKSEK